MNDETLLLAMPECVQVMISRGQEQLLLANKKVDLLAFEA